MKSDAGAKCLRVPCVAWLAHLAPIHVRTPSDTRQRAPEYIGGLYDTESVIRGKPAAERPRMRKEKATPLLQIYEASLKAKVDTLSSKSDTAKAINYSLNQWRALTLYSEDGTLEIDNNIAENALRCVSLGRNNAQPEIAPSPSLPKGAMRCADAMRKDSRSAALSIFTATPGAAGYVSVVDIGGSVHSAAGSGSVLAPSFSNQLLYSRALLAGFHVQTTKR
jgi:hypothetical protein